MMADISVAGRAKRKRGRPRKDSNLCNAAALPSPENSNFMPTPAAAAAAAADGTRKSSSCPDWEKNCRGEVGSMVYGVVEGSFDAGFLISVRIGNNLTPFRGVVFQPRKVVAVTAANDVAPQAKMYQRREIPVPVAPQQQAKVQYVHPGGNLRMVEEDEVMQAFEVSTSSGGSKGNQEQPPSTMDQPQVRPTNLFQDVNFQENLFSSHHNAREQESPNLKLDLAFSEKQMAEAQGIYTVMKNPNIGFHQALVAGNPLLLPPDLMGEPLEFMMDKPKTPPTSHETNMEVQSRLIGSDGAAPAPAPYKLELATPQNARIADMDFVISNAMQQSHTNN